jgi:hypothetical protein
MITRAPAAKKAVFDVLASLNGTGQPLEGAAVDYAYNAAAGPVRIYGGGWRFDQEADAAEGPGVSVAELIAINVYVEISAKPPRPVSDVDGEANAYAGAIGACLKANANLGAGMRVRGIATGQGGYSHDDDETLIRNVYQVLVSSTLAWG